MTVARVTSKGQVTIPAEIRRSLDIHEGDGLLFESPKEDGVRLRVIRHRPLTSLAGALPATRNYPGKAAVRENAGQALGKDLLGKVGS